MKTREEDAVRHLLVADTHDSLIFFTDRGRCFQVKAYEVTDESRQARGESIMQLLQLDQQERITGVVRVPADDGTRLHGDGHAAGRGQEDAAQELRQRTP